MNLLAIETATETVSVALSMNGELIERYEQLAQSDDEFIAAKAKRVILTQKPFPELLGHES